MVDVWNLHTKSSLKQYVSVMVLTAPSNPQTTHSVIKTLFVEPFLGRFSPFS